MRLGSCPQSFHRFAPSGSGGLSRDAEGLSGAESETHVFGVEAFHHGFEAIRRSVDVDLYRARGPSPVGVHDVAKAADRRAEKFNFVALLHAVVRPFLAVGVFDPARKRRFARTIQELAL